MAWITRLAILITLITLTPLVPAAGFLPPSRKVKTPDDTKISAWISVLLEDPDETKRINAAIELRNIDPKNHPDAIEALMEALKSDKRPSVRAEAANSLGRIRGGQDLAGPVLEEALANDGSMRVRLQARSALMGLYLSGYRSASGKSIPKAEETQEKAAGLGKTGGRTEPVRGKRSFAARPSHPTHRPCQGNQRIGTIGISGNSVLDGTQRPCPGGIGFQNRRCQVVVTANPGLSFHLGKNQQGNQR